MEDIGLKSAFLLLRCSNDKHDDCREIRDAILERSKNIQEIFTTKTAINGINYCIAGSALLSTDEIGKFEKDVKDASINGITIKDFKLTI